MTRVLEAVLTEFDKAEVAVAHAREALLERGFSHPSPGHVLQALKQAQDEERENEGEACGDSTRKNGVDSERTDGLSHESCSRERLSPSTLFLASAALSVSGQGKSETCIALAGVRVADGHREGRGYDDISLSQAESNLTRVSASDGWTSSVLPNGSMVATIMEDALGDDTDIWLGASDDNKEAFGSWGYRDSGFSLVSDPGGNGEPYVVMRGGRYG